MAFGSRMRLSVDELDIELAPLTKDAMVEFVEGLQQHDVTKFLSRQAAPTLEDEHEYYDRIRAEKDSLIWGVWVVKEGECQLIGTTALIRMTKNHVHQATSGSLIFRKEYWGRGIASHIHKARTWYAFQHVGLHCVKSAVVQGNAASRKALEKSGYRFTHVERNDQYVDGCLRHLDNLAVLNPINALWTQWWHGDPVPKRLKDARVVTQEAMDWAQQHVKLS